MKVSMFETVGVVSVSRLTCWCRTVSAGEFVCVVTTSAGELFV